MTDGTETMTKSAAPLTREEIAPFVAEWYRNLDVHVAGATRSPRW